ncbi:Zinc ribbon domain protein [Maioricimonas rarisocia]|uniref:Zinc ribbon domain protein n=1 Tax=Maioricimonas rarisocia TaxID=2528026 RepID=A0A517Z586_9PLAN|nr:zinc ribbon domain-containing protein [Maioricimonas rarisocia]QDU37613.1 Zinc ribbon domain protein [Maioricimonas rarisocia]
MPLFEYHCPNCNTSFEALVRNGEQPHCPDCQETRVEKLMSAAAGRVAAGSGLPIASSCPPSDAPPCNPHCCRLPQ